MAYTAVPGRTPAIAATRLAVASAAAAGAFALGHWWPAGSAPSEGVVLWVCAAAFLAAGGALMVPSTMTRRPPRVEVTPDGVSIPARGASMLTFTLGALVLFTIAGVSAYAAGIEGRRGGSPVMWGVIGAICAFGLGYLLVQRPWKRRIELTRDALILASGEETSRIPWDDIASIDRAPLLSTARSGLTSIREYNAAALTVARHSDTRRPRAPRLEDRYPTGDLAAPFATLLPALRQLAADPSARDALTHPDQLTERLTVRSATS